MKTHKNILDIFKGGLQEFVEVAVKQHHEKLLGRLSDSNNSGFTRVQSCNECTRRNLKPRHSENECPSENCCFCKSKPGDKRRCPNKVCDTIYEGIINTHVKFSPNLDTTNISQWTQNYWEIAMCFMKNRSESAESTRLVDLLLLVSNNRFILEKFLRGEADLDSEKNKSGFSEERLSNIQIIVDKDIKICRKLKRSAGICSSDDIKNLCCLLSKIDNENARQAKAALEKIAESLRVNVNKDCKTESDEQVNRTNRYATREADMTLKLTDMKIRVAVSDYLQKADDALKLRGKENEIMQLEILIEHKVDIDGTSEKEGLLDNSIATTVFGEKLPKKYIVTKADDRSRWGEYKWLIYNCLKHSSTSGKEGETDECRPLDNKRAVRYSIVYVVSKVFSDRVQLSLQSFSEYVRKQVKCAKEMCLIILDFRNDVVLQLFENDDNIFNKHTVIKITDDKKFIDKAKEHSSDIVLRLHPVAKLTIRKESTEIIQNKSCAKLIQNCLQECVKKLGPENIRKLTFENICFHDQSTKIKITFISNLKTLILDSCIFIPGFPSSLVSLEVEDKQRKLSNYLSQLNVYFQAAVRKCPSLEYLKFAEIKIGRTEFCMKLKTSAMLTSAKKYLGKTLIECDKDEVLGLLHHEISKVLNSTNCNLNDFEQIEDEDRKVVLTGVCYGLRESDQNLVHVYAAEFYESNESTEIVLVCYMQENFDVDEECVWGTYRGFKTFKKSYYHVCPELTDKKSDDIDENKLNNYFENSYKQINETIRKHSKQLMKDHSNLEIIGINLGKDYDPTDGPYIALYVRSKSFVPYEEHLFPSELTHPDNLKISFKTVVQEDFFVPCADAGLAEYNALGRVPYLAMGCSIGFEGNDKAASLGPFVEYQFKGKRETGFLTACHLFTLPENVNKIGCTKVVQPSEGDVGVNNAFPGQETCISSVCGVTFANVFDNEVDASLVLIKDRAPDKDRFITCTNGDFKAAGFSKERGMPAYKDGSIVDLQECIGKNVVKFGRTTGLTIGRCLVSESVVRLSNISEYEVRCPVFAKTRCICMMQQFEIQGAIEDRHFCDYGDSGAGVFLVNDDRSLSCVGIVIGLRVGGRTCIATPIKRVLHKLSRELGNEITLKTLPGHTTAEVESIIYQRTT